MRRPSLGGYTIRGGPDNMCVRVVLCGFCVRGFVVFCSLCAMHFHVFVASDFCFTMLVCGFRDQREQVTAMATIRLLDRGLEI